MTTVCSYGPGLYCGNLQLSLNGNADHIRNKTYPLECGNVTVNVVRHPKRCNCTHMATATNCSGTKWNISVIMRSCNQVELQCGNKRSVGALYDLSSPLVVKALPSKSVNCFKSYVLTHLHNSTLQTADPCTQISTQISNTNCAYFMWDTEQTHIRTPFWEKICIMQTLLIFCSVCRKSES